MSALTIQKEDVERLGAEIAEFEKLLPGVKFGEDFSVFALTLVGTKQFDELVMKASIIGLLSSLTVSAPNHESKDDFLERLANTSPLRELLMQAMYFGYRLGKT